MGKHHWLPLSNQGRSLQVVSPLEFIACSAAIIVRLVALQYSCWFQTYSAVTSGRGQPLLGLCALGRTALLQQL